MSTLGALSYRYDLTSTLCRELLYALIAVKKRFYELTGHETISEETLTEARQTLAAGVNGVLVELDPEKARQDQPTRQFWHTIIRQLKKKHKASLFDYVQQLQVTQTHLLTSPQALTEEDVQRLDEITHAISDDLAMLRRRIVRR